MATGCHSQNEKCIRTNGREKIAFKVLPFSLHDVKLLDGPFYHAMELNKTTLLHYNCDRLLSKFRMEAGLKPKAMHYDGWENESLAGHSLGHYLSGCALMYKTLGDTAFLNRVNYIVKELNECQKARGTGYIGASPNAENIFEKEIINGDIRSKGFDLNGIWAPIYTQHKILAGLLDAYQYCGNDTALKIAESFADWMKSYTSKLSDQQMEEMMNCEHGGINEALANLYSITGDTTYLALSERFYHKAILDPLSKGIDILPGKHANTQIPKLIGLSRLYELTENLNDRKTAEFFWDRVVHHHSYASGGHCDQEYFGPYDTLRNRLSENTTETCNVYNMLKLSQHLFEWEANPVVADFMERALLNHILSSQNPETGEVVYNLSLEMGGFKAFQDPEWFTCCIGTAMETHSKYGENIYYHNSEELYVTQFIASELNWKEKGIKLTQNTRFPEEQSSSLLINCQQPVEFNLFIRYPYWAQHGVQISVNGNNIEAIGKPSSFINIKRKWKDGDRIDIKMPFSLRLESMPDDSNRVAIMYGPLLMAGNLGSINDSNAYDPMFVPILLTDNRNPERWLTPVKDSCNMFTTHKIGQPRDFTLKAFYKIYDRRYSVYWDLFTLNKWELFKEKYQNDLKKKKDMETRTIDFFQPGEMQPERDHKFKSEKSWVGELKGRKFREVHNSWMSCELKTGKNIDVTLVVDYWGGYPGSKTFEIFIDDVFLVKENISNIDDGNFVAREYKIPAELLKNKAKVTVKFSAVDGNRAGPVFGVRSIKS